MDWSHYADKDMRESNKIYDDAYTSSWKVINGQLTALETTKCQEKARPMDCINSNKYNITQSLAETYEVFCHYEYKCSSNGQFIGEYFDDNGNVWQGRKVIFYNRAIKSNNPLFLNYQKNLQTIERTCDSTEIYSKLYVTPIESESMSNSYITIADAEANPLLEDYLLNFDYLYEVGAINDYQKEFIENYEVKIHELNKNLIYYGEQVNTYTAAVNTLEAEIAFLDKEILSAEESLVHYEELRDNEVTNQAVVKDATNACSVVFVPEGNILSAQLRFEGIAAGSIVGYKTYEYEKEDILFTAADFLKVKKITEIPETDTKTFYLVMDEYGYPTSIHASIANEKLNSTTGLLVYLALEYTPKNKYQDVCMSFQRTISIDTERKQRYSTKLTTLKEQLDDFTAKQNEQIKNKEALYQEMERVLGPALREGYWAPENTYEKALEKKDSTLTIAQNKKETSEAQFFFDTELFEEEEKGYYGKWSEYNSILGNAILSALRLGSIKDGVPAPLQEVYYKYLDISSILPSWKDQDLSQLVLHLQNPKFKYTATVTNTLKAGKYFVIYNGQRYYFTITSDVSQAEIIMEKGEASNYYPSMKVTYEDGSNVDVVMTTNDAGYEDAVNRSSLFENLGSYLGDYLIYPNAGFIFSFIKLTETAEAIPVLLFNSTSISYDSYTKIAWSFKNNNLSGTFDEAPKEKEFLMSYPRIAILAPNVNYDSDLLTLTLIKQDGTKIALTKYEDYSILTRNGKPYFTLKITANNSLYDILNHSYQIVYQISRANDILYLDAKQVAKENSRPKYSYTVALAQTPDNIEAVDLGQLVYINDYLLGVHAATGYVSEITLDLDEPQNDELKIQNYKTKFEDLFTTITAQAEAMKQSKLSYDLAANNFEGGALSAETLQTAIGDADLSFNFSNTNVTIDDVQGILLTNEKAYSNGVFGQVALQGGGIYLSNAMNLSTNERIWNTAITPAGINASLIRTGQLDTNVIRILAGNEMAFQWNSEGIFAYKNTEGSINPNVYVKYSQHGLEYKDNDIIMLSLDWNGLLMRDKNGNVTFSMDKETGDLTMSGIIEARGGKIGGLEINPDSLGSGTGVLISSKTIKITADHSNSILLDSSGIQLSTNIDEALTSISLNNNGIKLSTSIDNSSTLIEMNKNGILLQAIEGQDVNQLNLTNDFIAFGSNNNFSVSAAGIVTGQEASFNKLIVNGYPVNADTLRCVVSGGDTIPEGHNFLWFKPQTYQALTTNWGDFSNNNKTLSSSITSINLPLANKPAFNGTPGKVGYIIKFRTHMWNKGTSGQKTSIKNAPVTVTLECNGIEVGSTTEKVSMNVGGYSTPIFNISSSVNIFSEANTLPGSGVDLILKVKTDSHYNGQFILIASEPIEISANTVSSSMGNDTTNCEVYYVP